jgi:hypothetical protein
MQGETENAPVLFSCEYLMAEPTKRNTKLEPEIVLIGLWGWLSRRLGIDPWGQVLLIILIAIFSAMGTLVIIGVSKLTKIDTHLAIIDTKIGLQVGADLIGNVNTNLEKGDNAKAIQDVERAKSYILEAKERKTPAPPGYFLKTVNLLNTAARIASSDVAKELFSTRIALAEYRSALQTPPDIPEKLATLRIPPGTPITSDMLNGLAVYRITSQLHLYRNVNILSHGAVINGSEIPRGMDAFDPPSKSLAENNEWIDGLILYGVNQTLDGIEWKNVVFVDSHIKYLGGDIKLESVRFVNCTFDVPGNPRGAQLADCTILEERLLASG